MKTYTIVFTEIEMDALLQILDLHKRSTIKAIEEAPQLDGLKRHLSDMSILELKIKTQTTAPACQGQCGICDGTCNK